MWYFCKICGGIVNRVRLKIAVGVVIVAVCGLGVDVDGLAVAGLL